jgi:hypothetical protein
MLLSPNAGRDSAVEQIDHALRRLSSGAHSTKGVDD